MTPVPRPSSATLSGLARLAVPGARREERSNSDSRPHAAGAVTTPTSVVRVGGPGRLVRPGPAQPEHWSESATVGHDERAGLFVPVGPRPAQTELETKISGWPHKKLLWVTVMNKCDMTLSEVKNC
jgi:hypothetical protein